MTPAIAPIQPLLVALSWAAVPGTTYTVQTSPDLQDWQTLPFVIEGEGQQEEHALELLASPSFARLQFSNDGDSNENGLPDIWEWSHFGHLDTDPSADPDGDGTSTHAEWLNGTDPMDFFNGEIPLIQLSSGSEWFVPVGETAAQQFSVGVYRLNGEPWSGAPVQIEFESGFAGILPNGEFPLASSFIQLETDSLGRMDSGTAAFNILAPSQPGITELIRIRCGSASRRLLLRTTQALPGGPPRRLSRSLVTDGSVQYEWAGSAEGILSFRIQEMDSNGQWIQALALSHGELPELDPVSGLYSVHTNPLSN